MRFYFLAAYKILLPTIQNMTITFFVPPNIHSKSTRLEVITHTWFDEHTWGFWAWEISTEDIKNQID